MTKHDYLFISDDIVKEIIPTYQDIYDSRADWKEEERVRRSKLDTPNFGDKRISLYYSKQYKQVGYGGGYAMNLDLYKFTETRVNKFGSFNYYLRGNSGDHEMHGKNMVRSTRECNMNFMAKIFPIVKNLKYKDMKSYCDINTGEGFTQCIKDYIELMEKKGKLSTCSGRLPDALGDDFDFLYSGIDMGLL